MERKTQVLKTGKKVAVCLRGTWGADFRECGGNNMSEWWEPPKGGITVKQWQQWY